MDQDDEKPPALSPSVPMSLKESRKAIEAVELPGKVELKKIAEEAKKIEEEESDDDISYSESEMLDLIVRTRKATQFFLAMLPKLDKADENRLARAMAPIPEIQPK